MAFLAAMVTVERGCVWRPVFVTFFDHLDERSSSLKQAEQVTGAKIPVPVHRLPLICIANTSYVCTEVDVLISLSAASLYADGPTCTPSFVEKGQQAPWFCAKGLRHPTVGGTLASGNCFVPNDITLGGETHAPFMLLTGPNMGGKSTLLRQVCLAVTLAQVSSHSLKHPLLMLYHQSSMRSIS